MNAAQLAQTAYGTTLSSNCSDRGAEFKIFARITRRLKEHADSGTGGFPALVSALHDNRRLWTALASDVSEEDNALPDPLRAQIFYLSRFTQEHTGKILAGTATADALIDINTAVMRGLSGNSGAQG